MKYRLLRVTNGRGDDVAPESLATLLPGAAWDTAWRRFFAGVLLGGHRVVVALPDPIAVGAFEARVSSLDRAPFFAALRLAATVDGEEVAIGVTATRRGSATAYYISWAP